MVVDEAECRVAGQVETGLQLVVKAVEDEVEVEEVVTGREEISSTIDQLLTSSRLVSHNWP